MFSKACTYAIRAVLYLATHGSEAHKLGGKDVAGALDVPKAFLAKLLQQLARHNLIASSRGVNGGFYLKPEHRQARLRDIVECIDGKDALTACILGLPVCSSANPCPLHAEALKFREGLDQAIRNSNVESFTDAIKRQEIII